MDSVSSSGMDSNRKSMNTAYASLEQTIRNFSREKLMYQQQVGDLENQLGMANDFIETMTADQQGHDAKLQMLAADFDESETKRLNLTTSMAGIEEKLSVLELYVQEFERRHGGIEDRYEVQKGFMYSMKFRKLQLLKLFEEAKKKKEAAETMLQNYTENLATLKNDLVEASVRAENQAAECLLEKQQLIEELEKVKSSGEAKVAAITGEKAELQENFAKAVQKAEEERIVYAKEQAILQNQLQESKTEFELKISGLESEKNELSAKIEDIKKEINDMSQKMKKQVSLFEEEKAGLQKDLDCKERANQTQSLELFEGKTKLLKDLEEGRATLDSLKTKSSEEKSALLEDIEKLKMELKERDSEIGVSKLAMDEKLEEKKQLLDDFEQEREYLTLNNKASLEKLNQEFEQVNRDLKELRSRYSDQKHAIEKLIEETSIKSPALHQWKDSDDPSKQKAKVVPTTPTSAVAILPVKPSPLAARRTRIPITPSRAELLKSPRASSFFKGSNHEMSFSIADFIISSSSDTESDATPAEGSSTGKQPPFKKPKLMGKRKEIADDDLSSDEEFKRPAIPVLVPPKTPRRIKSIARSPAKTP